MLDDLNVISQKDPQNALGYIQQQPEQLLHDFNLSSTVFGTINNVVFAGMGGSALIAEIARVYPQMKKPFIVSKDYMLPAFVGPETLVICSSYSGNTEETLSALAQAEECNAQIAVIAHGGKLVEEAQQKGYPLAQIPECPQPRTSIFYAYRALSELFVAADVADLSLIDELEALAEPLATATALWRASVPESQNQAKQMAQKMVGKTPIIYGGGTTYPAAYKWKISCNENAKNTAWCNALPEFNHNEFIGWSSHPVDKPFAVIDLLSTFEHPRTVKRFEVTDRLLSGLRPKSVQVHAEGETILGQLLYFILLGDYATTYLAILNGVNPTPVDLVERFKKELG